MARNEEKHFGRLNRLYLMKEKDEFEKAHPKRPRLDTLDNPEEVQKWLPSIKRDIDFYLKKTQVPCYSDAHVEECKEKVIKLEKEFKAFVRKIKQLTNSPAEAIPWTSRPYKRKKIESSEESASKEFKYIATPILNNEEKINSDIVTLSYTGVNWNLMNEPLSFDSKPKDTELEVSKHYSVNLETQSTCKISNSYSENFDENNSEHQVHNFMSETKNNLKEIHNFVSETSETKDIKPIKAVNIVNYDSSDSETS